jgi:hypothetical protein
VGSRRHAVEGLAERHIPGIEASDHQIALELGLQGCLDISLASLWGELVDVLQFDLQMLVESQATREALVLHIANTVLSKSQWADPAIRGQGHERGQSSKSCVHSGHVSLIQNLPRFIRERLALVRDLIQLVFEADKHVK